jgi:glycosyltransferase involved in cell wall biosynthesis
MHPTPLVSVAMATYNGAEYLGQQLRSIVDQSYTNLEIFITDDASTDGTIDILEMYRRRYDFIKISRHQENMGITASFEHSIKNCRGDFIAISDQDDIWDLNKISVMMESIGNEDLIYSDSELVDKNGRSMNRLISSFANLKSFRSGIPFLTGVCLPGHTMLMQGDFARYILPVPRVIMYDRWISYCAAANNGIKFLDLPLVQYRQHETNSFGIGKSTPKKKSSRAQKFHRKLLELKACEKAPIKNIETQMLLGEMLNYFTKKPSLRRSLFFFKHRNKLLAIKKRNQFRKILYCLKMFFKANY